MRRLFATWALAALVFFSGTSSPAADAAPAVSDESRLIRLESKVDAINDRLAGIEKRMDRLDQRMDRIEQRIDRLEESLRTDMNSHFDRLNDLLIGLCSIFGLLVVALFGFVLWDRRSMLRPLESDMRRLATSPPRARRASWTRRSTPYEPGHNRINNWLPSSSA